MKKLAIFRHGRKDGELVSKDQIAEIVNHGIPGLNELVARHNGPIMFHLGSEFRGTETMNAFEKYLDTKANYDFGGYLLSDSRLGNAEMFKRFLTPSKIKTESGKIGWYNSFQIHDPEFLKETQQDLLEAAKQAFGFSPEDSLIICVCHTPLIEWLSYKLDPKEKISRNTQLKELTGFVIKEANGKISVYDTIGF